MTFTRLVALALAIGMAAVTVPAAAQAQYPTRPIKLVVPLTPGGPADVISRVLAQKMSDALGQQVVVENRAGANMNVGAEYVARSAPDGYTMLLSATPLVVNPSMYQRLAYDTVKDFAPITVVATFPLVVIVNPALPVKTISELIDYARKHPGELNYGSAGNGSSTHLAGAMLSSMADVKLVHVPYRGLNEVVADLIGGRVQLAFGGGPVAIPNAKAGKVRALATTGIRRTAFAPDLPTVAESGLPGYDTTAFVGISAPTGTPPAVIKRWHTELVRILQTAEIKERWLGLGVDSVFSATPEEFASLIDVELVKWAKVVKESGAKIE